MEFPRSRRWWLAVALGSAALACGRDTNAPGALAAVAANFVEPLEALVREFSRDSPCRISVAAGSTGKLYAQILNGAPYDVFLAADQVRPRLLVASGRAVADSRFTYASGRLALWSPDPLVVGPDGKQILSEGRFRSMAIANPELAPYGLAARQTLLALGLWDHLKPKIVLGENIGQTHALVSTGNAELGFVALSQLTGLLHKTPGSRWEVPADLHDPIDQDAVLLSRAAENACARQFLEFLRGPSRRAAIRRFGYSVD